MPELPTYVVALCEGDRCLPLLALDDERRPHAVDLLGRLAAWLRARDALGRLVLRNERTGEVVAARRVWP